MCIRDSPNYHKTLNKKENNEEKMKYLINNKILNCFANKQNFINITYEELKEMCIRDRM